MSIDYEHMRFNDLLVQNNQNNSNINITELSNSTTLDDFSIIPEQEREKIAKKEITKVVQQDIKIIKEHDKKQNTQDPFNNVDDVYKDLGLL